MDMDTRSCPNYNAGVDACDPLGSVIAWSDSCKGRAARVVRRRCRSEGVERSPYEDVHSDWPLDHHRLRSHRQPAKSHFTLHNGYIDRYQDECSLPAAENGDFHMAYDQSKQGYQSSKHKNRSSPTRSPVRNASITIKEKKSRLPKVEELFEKIDHDMLEMTTPKQPLKSILNNPTVNLPAGILKKPSAKYKETKNGEGRRRQRAASESDNLYCNYHLSSPIPAYDTRLTYLSSSTTKRAKDNMGTSYSYGSAFAMTTSPTSSKSPNNKTTKCVCKNEPERNGEVHVLRTTAINNKMPADDNVIDMVPRFESLPPACPAVAPAQPVPSVTVVKKTLKKKVKAKPIKSKSKVECKNGTDAAHERHSPIVRSRSTSPDLDPTWQMETDNLLAEIDKLEKSLPTKSPPSPPQNAKGDDVKKEEVNGVTKTEKKVETPKKESPLSIPDLLTNILRPSLFPRVPPYLRFAAHDDPAIKIPASISKHLKWKLTNITPIVVKKTLMNSGFRLVKSECDTAECPQEETVEWVGIWGKHMKSLMFRAIKDGQKMNHFPGTFQIGRKDRLWRNLQKLAVRFGSEEFGIMPKTYVLPHDMKILKQEWDKYAADNEKWIIKPPASARGTGIKVVTRWTQIPKKRPVVVQRYISKPYLINGSKFDLRLYVLVTSIHPLRIYMFKDGLARFASVKYNDDVSTLSDRYMHLTNYSINRLSKNYTPNEDFEACEGHKWTLKALFQYLQTEKKVDTEALWESLKDLVIKTVISGEASISSLTKANITSRYNCYELFGIDVLLDEDLKPWLLEANISPSLHSASPLDIHVKGPLVAAVLALAQFHVPARAHLDSLHTVHPAHSARGHTLAGLPYDSRLYTVYLSKEERDKHIIYTNMEDRDMYLRDILSTLTPDDVRHLLQAEDELSQAETCERIFPQPHTHKYLKYCSARYYNRLFDAWETRYGSDRKAGVELLRNLCYIGYHLEVPPVPLKNDVDAPSPAPSAPPSVLRLVGDEEAECPSAGSL